MSDNIQVIVRCRARNEREIASSSPSIIGLANDVHSQDEPFISVNTLTSSLVSNAISASGTDPNSMGPGKVFKVDQVYGPNADQALLFENVALPLFHDFVNGLNVTILAYGQTGSGKTYTMCGDLQGEHAGIIPRVLSKLFDVLTGDYCVKLSCVELYKEELRDLINDQDIMNNKGKLRLVSDGTKKTATVQNLTEVHIDSYAMGFKILQMCLNKRKTSFTKLNDHSSRSHTVFTINIYRQANPGDSMSDYCVSKMNLVDLAGSEDINKSGAVNERAREAGSINQSLLALGKVINSLSEGKESKHVPYRESKLTRLLQGSIGGKTKTALIAAISPAKINAHETTSTLNYASKAKNIKNIPQSTNDSEMVLKKVLVNDLSSQIARVTRDLLASKDKEGNIKMSVQNYAEWNKKMMTMETDLNERNAEVHGLVLRLTRKENEIEKLQQQLKITEALRADATAQLAKKRDEVSSLDIQISILREKYTNKNEQLAQIMLINICDINDVLTSFQQSIMDDKSLIGNELESLKSQIVQQVQNLRTDLKKKCDIIQQSMQSEIESLQTLLLKSLDVSSYFGKISECNFDKQIGTLRDNNKRFSENMVKVLDAEYPAFKEIAEIADRRYLSESTKLKDRMISQITSTIENIFINNMQVVNDTLKLTVSDVLNSGNERIEGIHSKHIGDLVPIFHEMQDINNEIKLNVLDLEAHLKDDTVPNVRNVGARMKSKLSSTISKITDLKLTDDSVAMGKIQNSIDMARQSLDNIGTSTANNHHRTTGVFKNFRSVLASIERSPNTTKSIPASPKRSQSSHTLGNSPKRRKPIMHSNIIRSQIPQLSHSSKSDL